MRCPICSKEVMVNFQIVEEVKPTDWGVCVCGTMFHEMPINKKYFGKLYLRQWKERVDLKERFEYLQRVFIPIVEEQTFGRKFLDVGFTLPYTINYLKDRGWVTAGIDLVPNDQIQADFETFLIPEKFDYINMGHCLESFDDPVKALKKAYGLLNNLGMLLITQSDPETIFELGISKFGNWNYKQNHIFISKRKLEDIVRRLGFEIIVSYRNISNRFVMNNDLHMLLQRREECKIC